MKGLEKVRQQEDEVLEAQSAPVRNYLMEHVIPTLTQGLIECCKVRPEDPVDFLVFFTALFIPTSKCFSGFIRFWSWQSLLVFLISGGVLVMEQPLKLLKAWFIFVAAQMWFSHLSSTTFYPKWGHERLEPIARGSQFLTGLTYNIDRQSTMQYIYRH